MAEVKDLVVSESLKKELATLSDEDRAEVLQALKEDLKGNLEGEEPEFPQIKVLHSAALYEFPDGKKEEKFDGIILEILKARAWWKEASGKDRVPPSCFSMDWLKPDPECDEPQAENCRACQWNRWGSAIDAQGASTRGKACRMRKRVFLKMAGHEIPMVLSVSPMSLKSLRNYLVLLSDKSIQKNRAVSEFSLQLQDEGTQVFSIIDFEMKRECSLADFLDARKMRDAYLGHMKTIPIEADEFEVQESDSESEPVSEEVAQAPEEKDKTLPKEKKRNSKSGKNDVPF